MNSTNIKSGDDTLHDAPLRGTYTVIVGHVFQKRREAHVEPLGNFTSTFEKSIASPSEKSSKTPESYVNSPVRGVGMKFYVALYVAVRI